jgi:hypothetical protein
LEILDSAIIDTANVGLTAMDHTKQVTNSIGINIEIDNGESDLYNASHLPLQRFLGVKNFATMLLEHFLGFPLVTNFWVTYRLTYSQLPCGVTKRLGRSKIIRNNNMIFDFNPN